MPDVIRIVLVDDDPLVRAGLKLLLGGTPDLEIVAEAVDGVEAAGVVRDHSPDVVLMDIRMPKVDGLSATKQIVSRPGAPKVIVLTTFDSDDHVLTALQLGAAGFLLKDTPPERMVQVIRQVADGEPGFSPSVLRQVVAAATRGAGTARRDEARALLSGLTEREREVALAIGEGRSNAEISASLYLSVATVKAYVTRLFTKLGVTNRVQIAMVVHDAELDQP